MHIIAPKNAINAKVAHLPLLRLLFLRTAVTSPTLFQCAV